jgi:hypothetical protein
MRAGTLSYPRGVRLLALPFSMIAAVLAGCINTDAAVFVEPTISSPAMTVMGSALGTGITSGSFHLDLHLGARASGPSTVSLVSFAILDAQMQQDIVDPLMATSSTPFPATVQPDSDVNADFTFNTGAALLPAAKGTALCASAGVVIRGTIQDSLMGATPTTRYSPVFHPSGCM